MLVSVEINSQDHQQYQRRAAQDHRQKPLGRGGLGRGRRLEGFEERRHGLNALLGLHGQAVLYGALERHRRHAQQGEIQPVPVEAIHGLGRNDAGDAVVEGGGEGVDVRPGAGAAPLHVLLQGAEAGLGHQLGGHAASDGEILGGAEVQQAEGTVGLHHDVVGADVPVDHAQLVHGGHALHEGREQLDGLGHGEGAPALEPFAQGDALGKVHDDVGGVVLVEGLPHPHHPGHGADLGHFPRFFEKALAAGLPLAALLVGGVPMHFVGLGLISGELIQGKILLDGDLELQRQIEAHIGDAEAALSQHAPDQIFAVEDGAGAQGIGDFLALGGVVAAVGADGGVAHLGHTVEAAVDLHGAFLLSHEVVWCMAREKQAPTGHAAEAMAGAIDPETPRWRYYCPHQCSCAFRRGGGGNPATHRG